MTQPSKMKPWTILYYLIFVILFPFSFTFVFVGIAWRLLEGMFQAGYDLTDEILLTIATMSSKEKRRNDKP